MSKFTKEMVDTYAEKLLIGLTDEENEMVLKEFDVIESNMEKLTKIPNLSNVEPMTHALDDFSFALRDDVKEDSVSVEDALKNCKSVDDREVSVPKVVGE